MRPFGIVGWSGAGKTTLVTALIPELKQRGVTVATIKHTHHDIDLDKPGKDSYQHRHAGAVETLLAGPKRWTLIHEEGIEDLNQLLSVLSPVDLVLVEGFKTDPIPRIEVFRPGLGKPRLCPEDGHLLAVASDQELPDLTLPRLDLNDVPAVADFILGAIGHA